MNLIQLEFLYKKRNRIVHRYIISEISTKEVLSIGVQYENIIPIVSRRVEELERKQIELGIGMTLYSNELDSQLKLRIDKMAAKKHQDAILNHALKKGK